MAASDIKAGRAVVEVSIRDKLTQGLKLAEKRLQTFGRYVATTAGVVGAGIGGALAWPIKLAADVEQATTTFEVFLGSAAAAGKMVSDIQSMSTQTPFDFEQLQQQAKLLLTFGISGQQLIPTMQALGDVSGGNAERFGLLSLAYGQVISKGHLMGQEARQMQEQGFNPLLEISHLTGKSMKSVSDAMADGAISAGMVTAALAMATSKGGKYFGMMDRQSKTMSGMWIALMGNAKMAMAAFGNALLPTLKSFATVGMTAVSVISGFIKNNQALVATIAKVVLGVGIVAAAITAFGIASLYVSFVVGVVASSLLAVFSIIGLIFSPLGVLIGLFIAAGVAAYVYRDAVIETLQGILIIMQPWVDAVKGYFSSIGQAILAGRWDLAGSIAMAKLQLAIQSAWTPISQFWTLAMSGFGVAWDYTVYGMRTAFRTVVFAIAKSGLWLVQQLSNAIKLMVPLFESIGQGEFAKRIAAGIDPKAMGQVISSMQANAQAEDDKALRQNDGSRLANIMNSGQKSTEAEKIIRAQIAALEAESAKAYMDAGAPTIASRLNEAKDALKNALGMATAEAAKAGRAPLIPDFSKGVEQKTVAQGTFTAAAAALFGGSDNAGQTTARNTSALVKLAQDNARKKGPAFT